MLCKLKAPHLLRILAHLPRAIIAILSPRMSASSMLCVVSTTARPFFASWMMSHTYRLLMGSMPEAAAAGRAPNICEQVSKDI